MFNRKEAENKGWIEEGLFRNVRYLHVKKDDKAIQYGYAGWFTNWEGDVRVSIYGKPYWISLDNIVVMEYNEEE